MNPFSELLCENVTVLSVNLPVLRHLADIRMTFVRFGVTGYVIHKTISGLRSLLYYKHHPGTGEGIQ